MLLLQNYLLHSCKSQLIVGISSHDEPHDESHARNVFSFIGWRALHAEMFGLFARGTGHTAAGCPRVKVKAAPQARRP